MNRKSPEAQFADWHLQIHNFIYHFPDFIPSLLRFRRERNDDCPGNQIQSRFHRLHLFLYLATFDFIQLRCYDNWVVSLFYDPVIHHLIIGRRIMTDINQQKYRLQLFRTMQISLNQFSPLDFFLLGYFCIPISRQIYQIYRFIDIIEIDSLGLSRCS